MVANRTFSLSDWVSDVKLNLRVEPAENLVRLSDAGSLESLTKKNDYSHQTSEFHGHVSLKEPFQYQRGKKYLLVEYEEAIPTRAG